MTNRATLAIIDYTKDATTVDLAKPEGTVTHVELGKVGKSVSGRKVVDRALAKSGMIAGPFLEYKWRE